MYKTLLILIIAYGAFKIFKLLFSLHIIKRSTITRDNPRTFFTVIVPVYNEQKRIGQFLSEFEKVRYCPSLIRVIFCTTAKEKATPSTKDVLERLIKEKHRFSYEIVEFPEQYGSMAEQVNYAYSNCNKADDVIVIYNADSVVHPDTFREAASAFENYSYINVMQQRILFFQSINNNPFSIGYSLHQSAYELTVNWWSDYFEGSINVCGRGLFVRNTFIESELNSQIYPTGFFCEDLALSFMLNCRKVKTYPLMLLEANEPPLDFKSIVNQHYVWFSTAISLSSFYGYIKSEFIIPMNFWYFCVERTIKNMYWLLGPILLWFVIFNNIWSVIPVILYSFSIAMLFKKQLQQNNKSVIFASLYLFIYLLVLNFGPLKLLYHRLTLLLGLKKELVKYKTPRGEDY